MVGLQQDWPGQVMKRLSEYSGWKATKWLSGWFIFVLLFVLACGTVAIVVLSLVSALRLP